ncbi:MAG: undecaprenyl-diphosphate phosphatase [Lentisphaeraceae bacterium]|nr:undecaprenyl-diphosphate phosphatase [Lentisphaeraceae bacterium]
MHETVKALIMGVVQGLAEFLPVSSSGHLILAEELLDFKEGSLAFDVFVHFGTLFAIFIYFRKDIWQMIKTLPAVPAFFFNGLKLKNDREQPVAFSAYVIIASIPTAIIGLTFKDQVETVFRDPKMVAAALLFTAAILFSTKFIKDKGHFICWWQAVLIGLVQGMAIIPGISRSGTTIIVALWLGIARETSARFSFIMSIPAVAGAVLLQCKDLMNTNESIPLLTYATGTIVAAASGYLAIIFVMDLVKKQKLEYFAYYCLAVSLAAFLFM